MSHPVRRHNVLLQPDPGIRFTHWGKRLQLFSHLGRTACKQVTWVHTCPCDWDSLVAVVLLFLRCSIQLDPRILSADGLLIVVFVALIFRPLLRERKKNLFLDLNPAKQAANITADTNMMMSHQGPLIIIWQLTCYIFTMWT